MSNQSDKFKRFEVEAVHISDAMLGRDELAPHKFINIRVRANMELVQSLAEPGPSPDELAEELATVVAKRLLDLWLEPKMGVRKVGPDFRKEAKDGEFGYYPLVSNSTLNRPS